MKKMLLTAGVIVSLLASCETEKEDLIVTSTQADTKAILTQNADQDSSQIKQASSYLMLTNQDKFNIVFSQDLNNDKSGSYLESEWKGDWNALWANHNLGYGSIATSGTNKYLTQSFPAGAFGVSKGYQWMIKFSKGYNELYFSYRIKFSSGFTNTNLHGKLPGLSGGASNSGGNLPTGTDGWSARYMFHGTKINFYLYYPEVYKNFGDASPVAGKTYYGAGPDLNPGFTLKTDTWYTVTQRIVMNTVGKSNGLVEGFINGKLCAVKTGIRFRDVSTLMIDRLFFANFFGGSGVAPSQSVSINFDDFFVYTYASSVSVARGNVTNPAGTTIIVPVVQ